jgi:hypothetical protein
MLIATTVSYHTPAFGSEEPFLARALHYHQVQDSAGTITLDGQNPDALYFYHFAAAAQSKVILSNGTRRCNVFDF